MDAGTRPADADADADAPFRLTGRVAVVTGSSSGLGEAIAHELAAAGAAVVVSSRELARAEAVAGAIAGAGGRAIAVAGDVTDPAVVEELAARARDELGGLDVWVNNAGIGMVRPSLELSLEDWQRTMDLDLTATWVGCQVAGRHMVAAGRGVIVNVSSVAGHTALPQRAAYCAAKHGVVGLTKVLATEWAPHGRAGRLGRPRVRHDAPSSARAWPTAGSPPEDVEGRTPLGRLGEAVEVARAVRFLASDAASYVTGAQLMVDGGWTADGGWWTPADLTARGPRGETNAR
jgi:NAD(P)-dependent dehydrogenase (short-subunit alcohol dehydrogenase family)